MRLVNPFRVNFVVVGWWGSRPTSGVEILDTLWIFQVRDPIGRSKLPLTMLWSTTARAARPSCRLGALRALRSEPPRRPFAASAAKEQLVLRADRNGVRTLTMNNPRRFNAWSQPMLRALFDEFTAAAEDDDVGVVVLTGTGKYYCAGVDLAGVLKPMHPQTLHDLIYGNNKLLFDTFLEFPKPLIAAVNGPAIGAPVTTATLCDALVISEHATLSTPFARLGLAPEGCSSVHFPRVMGEATAHRMLGPESWAPTAAEAVEVGLAHKAVTLGGGSEEDDSDEKEKLAKMDALLLDEAQAIAESWITEGRLHRSLPGERVGGDGMGAAKAGAEAAAAQEGLDAYKVVNQEESVDLARRFLSPDLLQAQIDLMSSKGKTKPAAVFKALLASRPLWSMLLQDDADILRHGGKK